MSKLNDYEQILKEKFSVLDDISFYNTQKILEIFKKNRLALRHFNPTTGYGYGDEGRDTLNLVVADVFKAQKAICSPNIVSGTHAISLGLFGVLRPGDTALSITGKPYDTLIDVIEGEGNGSLKDYNIKFDYIDLKNGEIDREEIKLYLLNNRPKMIFMQRSRGYEWRDALSIEKIKQNIEFLRACDFKGCIYLDNCYGEFVEKEEPIEVGANLVAGSMIKNMGGGIAPTGGYLAGDEVYIDMVQNRLTAPSIGGEVSSYAFTYQYFFQGLFLAPHVVNQALKASLLLGVALEDNGYKTSPSLDKMPSDIIRAVEFNTEEELISFIQNVQKSSPVDGFVDAMPWDMPGYENQVIMAAGCFVQGASIELSADAPIKKPYIAYVQGSLSYEHMKVMLKNFGLI